MASNPFDEFDAPATPGAAPAAAPAPAPQTNAFDEFDNAKPAGMMRRVLGDGGIALAKGIIGVPEAAVGLADLATGGRVGKALENEGGAVGFRPKQAKEYLDTFKSGEQQLADARVAAAGQDGDLLDYGKALIQNPSTLVSAGVESAPSFIGGAAVARGFMKGAQLAGRAMSPVVAGAVGEGAVAAGQNAEQVRQETETGLLTPGQSGVLAASGAVTGALGFGSGKLAQRLGIGDIETMLAQGKFGPVPKVPKTEAERILAEKAASKGLLRKVGEGFVTEGILQETPQSAQEQAAQNIALGKPLMEGVGQAAIQGGLVGGFMGAGGAGLSDIMEGRRPPAAAPAPLPGPFSAAVETLALPAPGMGGAGRPIAVGPDGEASTGAQRDSVESQRLQAGLANPRPRSTDGLVETGAAIGQGYPVIDAPARTVADNPAAPVATPAQTVGNTPREIAYNQASDEDRSLYDSIFGAPDVQDVQAKAPNMLDAALARDVNWEIDPESETPEADFLAAMGFTEEEQQDAIEEANRQLREEAQSAAAAPARDGSGDAEAAANGPAAARAPAGDQEGRAAVGAGQAQAVAAPTLDTTGWTVKKLGERSMEELNDLWQQVRAAHSRPVVGDGPVDETGLATSEPLTEEGQRLRTMLERAQKIAYDRRKAERAKEQANGSDVLATDQPPADAGAAAGAGGAGAAEARAAGVPGAVAEQGAGAGAGGDEPRAGRAARAGGGNGAAERPVAEPVGRAAEQPGGGAVVVDAGGQPDGPDGANRLGGRGRAGGAATANTGAGAGGAELTYTGPTMAEINAISDVKTVDVIREAQDMVGEDELRRRAQQKIDDYSKGGKFKVSEPMMIEATAREVVALGRRAQAAAKATRDNQPVLEQDRNGLAERRAPLEGKERWPAPLAMKGAPKELAPAQQAVVAYMNGDISRTEMLQALANSGLPYGTMGGITQRLGNDGPSIGELEHLSQGRMPPAPETQDIDAAAHEAATSPTNDLPEPTDAQKEAGNYKKGHINVQGLDISVENPKGSTRSGTREDGSTWSHEMSDHYGYVKRTTGADGEQIDVYIGPEPDAGTVYVVDQIDQGTGRFDEHKAMIGYPSREAAREAYASNFDKDWKVGRITAMSMDEFKEFISDPKRSQFPASGINDGPNGPKPQTPYQKAKQKAELRNLRDNRNQRPEPAPVEEIDTLLEGLPVAQLNAMAADLGAPIGANRAMTEASIEAKESDLAKLQALAAKHADASTEPRIVTAEQVVNDKERAPDVKTDECLVLMACGNMKLDHRARADELYTGPFWTTYRTHEPKGTKPQMVVLSAKHGFVPRDQMLSPYDQEMTAERQGELMGQLGVQVDNIQKALKGRKVKDVLIVGGKNYRDLMASAVLELQKRGSISQDASINRTEGEIGEQRSDLGKYLNGLPSAASAAAPAPAPTTAPATAKPKRENKLQRELREAEEARSAYFTPGNVVRSYGGGFDRVVSYQPPKTPGGQWSVSVQAVTKTGPATFEDTPNERVRTHSTQPRPSELKTGPAGKMSQPTRQELKAELDALQAEANGRAPVEYLNEQQLERRRQILDQMDKAPEAPAPETTPEPEPAEATHADPGEAAEPATAPVVAESLQKAARAEDRTPAQMKADLLAQVDEAMKTASTDPEALRQMQLATYTVGKPSKDDVQRYWRDHPKLSYGQAEEELTKRRQMAQDAKSAEAAEQVGYVTFDVPGDGKFKVVNHVEKLAEFRKKVQASPGFKAPAPRADNTPKAPASAGTVAAIQNMVEEGDFQAALDYATAKGVDLGDIKMTKAERSKLDAWLKTNPTPTGEEATDPVEAIRAFREEFAIEPKGKPIAELAKHAARRLRAKEALAKELAPQAHGIVVPTGNGFVAVTKDVNDDGKWRITRFDKDMEPHGHEVYNTAEDAVEQAIDRFRPEAAPAPAAAPAVAQVTDNMAAAAAPATAQPAKPTDVSTVAGQKALANRGTTIASLQAMNGQLRKIAPNEAWSDQAIAEASAAELDSLRDRISTALVNAQRGPQPAPADDGLRAELEELSGQELRAIFERMNLAGARMTASERVDALLAEDHDAVRAALTPAAADGWVDVEEGAAASEPARIDIEMGGSTIGLDLPKPAHQMTRAELTEAIRDANLQGYKDFNLKSFLEKHGAMVKAALDSGQSVPDEVLADFTGLIRNDLTDDQADQMADDLSKLSGTEYVKAARAWKPSRSSTAWKNEGKSPAELVEERAVELGRELAGTIATESKEKDFDAKEIPAGIQQWADDNKVPADSLRAAVLKALPDTGINAVRRKQVEAALNPVKSAAATAKLGPPTFDYRLKKRGGQTYLVPPVGQAFSKETRNALRDWLRDAGYFVNATGDNEIAVSSTSNSPPVDHIVDGVEDQRLERAVNKERAKVAAPATSIADAGEKIGGARKDRWKERGMDVSDLDAMSESEGAELATKANVWKPDWAKLVEDGMNPALAAHAKIIYDRLAAQPKDNTPAGRRRFVQMMQAVRQVYGSLTPENVASAATRLRQAIGYNEAAASGDRQKVADARSLLFSVYKGRSDPFSFDSMDMRKVRKMIEEGFPAKGEAWKKRFSTRERPIKGITPRGRELLTADAEKLGTPIDFAQLESDGGTYWEVRQNANNRVVGYATSQAQADELGRAAYAKALADGKSTLVQPERPHLDALERTGLPQRLDRDATPDDFIKDFGFRGVEFGNWSAQDERQRIINMAYDGLMDLAQIMGVPPQAMSLNGKLGMAFGARGGGKFAAHYEPGRLVINMTKIRGGGSMAHEWAHALDHYFGELDRADAYMGKARGASGWTTQENYNGLPRDRMEKDAQGNWVNVKRTRLENLRPEVARAFDRVMSSLFSEQISKAERVRALELRLEREQARAAAMTDPQMKKVYEDGVARTEAELARVRAMDDSATFEGGRSSYSTEASKLDKGKANGYWSQPTELFARAFESWVQDRIQGMGAKSDYLVHGVEGNRFTGEQYAGNPYPSGKERDAINAAFDNLAKTIKTRDGNDGRATMFSIDDQTDTPAFKAWFGDSKVVDEQGKPLVVYHGTNADFTAFSGRPVWFHADPSQAFASGDGANVMPAYVRIENPIRRSGYFGMEDFTNPARFKFFDKTTGKWVTPDGVIGDNGIVVAFRPEQIKSATGNNGAFDPTNPNITMDLEGLPTIDQNFAVPEDVLPPRYQAASPTRQAKVERLQANLRKQYGPGVTIQAVEPGQMSELEAQAMAGVRSTASRLFGHDVVFVRFPPGSTPLFNGVVSQDQNGTIFVNMDARRPHMAVVGHELLHQLRTNNAPLYQQLQQRMAAIYKSGAEGQYFDRIRSAYAMHGLPVPKEWQEEMLADVVGDHFMDPQFWSDIGAGMKPGPFKMLVQAILRFIDRLRGLMTGARPFGTEQYLNDLEAARAAVVQAMGQFSAQQMANPGQRTNVQARVADQEEGPLDRGTMLSIATDPQALQQAARESFATLMNTPGKLNWWHKTVGSPYNLAQKSPAFKRVYDNVQDFLKDVSGYATEAADLAPNLLPKLESIKDVAKKPISAEDSKAIAAPIFEGTLTWARDPSTGKAVKAKELEDRFAQHTTEQKAQMMLRKDLVSEGELKSWQALPPASYQGAVNNRFEQTVLRPGVVWSDAELKSQFGLNDRQVAQYREFRAAIDKSLESLGLSDIVRFAGKDGKAVAQMVMDSGDVRTGSELMRDHLLAMAEADPRRNTELIDTANRVVEKADRIKQLQREGYAPLSRFGKYTVDVVDKDGERAYFGLFESRFEAAKMANQMQKNYPDATVTQGTMSKEAHQLFAGVSPETLELFGDMLGLEAQGSGPQHEAFQQYLKLAKSNRSAMKRLIERKGIAGFSEDPARVLAGFIYSNARQTSSAIHQGDILESVNDIPQQQGELKDAAVKLANYVNNPVEEAAGFRGLLFTQYIGGSIASAMVNLTQPLQTTLPYLSQFGGVRQAAKNVRSASRDALRPDEALKDSEPDLYRALKRAEEDGTVSPQEVHQLMAQARGAATLKSGDGTTLGNAWAGAQNKFEQLTFAWGKLFSTAEQYNRRTTFIASYRTAKDNGMSPSEAFKFAEKAINETQFVANKGNRPRWARGAIGSTLFTFKSYSVNYVEMLARMATAGEPGSPERAAGQRAALLALGVLFLMGGAGGLPFTDDVGDLIDAVMQRLGYNFNTKQKRQELLQDIFGEAGGKFVDKGVSGLSGFPLDVSGRMGMGNLIPGTGLLTKKEDYSRDALEVFGAAGDFGKRVAQSAEAVSGGQFGKAAQTIAPKAAGNLIQGIDMANTGMYRDQKGRKVIDTTAAEAAMKMIGFQPTSVARVQEATGDQYNAIAQNRIQSQAISDLWAEGMATRDPAKVQEAQQMLRDWNAKNPDTPIRPNLKAIQAKAKTMMQDKVTRLEKTAPKAMRAEVRRELQNDLR